MILVQLQYTLLPSALWSILFTNILQPAASLVRTLIQKQSPVLSDCHSHSQVMQLKCMRVSVQSVAAATPLDGPILQRYLRLAKENSLWLSLGGFQEYCSMDPQRLQNCHVIVNSAGQVVATYRKVHLFDVEVFNGPVLKETSFTVPGKEVWYLSLFALCPLPSALCPSPFALCPLPSALCSHLRLRHHMLCLVNPKSALVWLPKRICHVKLQQNSGNCAHAVIHQLLMALNGTFGFFTLHLALQYALGV